jgi:hypothetical protein
MALKQIFIFPLMQNLYFCGTIVFAIIKVFITQVTLQNCFIFAVRLQGLRNVLQAALRIPVVFWRLYAFLITELGHQTAASSGTVMADLVLRIVASCAIDNLGRLCFNFLGCFNFIITLLLFVSLPLRLLLIS